MSSFRSTATALFVLLALLAESCGERASPAGPRALRVGHFPNITHAHGLVAHSLTREEKGWFEERLGPGVKVEWFTYNAGPSAMEALLLGAIDLAYVGPSPALNAYVKSRGEEVRVIAGATLGGSALVVPGDGRVREPEDFRGKRIATPQLGNTQDVACRAWLSEHGFHVTQTGGDVQVLPTQNSDQLALFQKGELAGVWTVEPWVSRLELEAGGKVFLQEDDALTVVLVASARFLRESPELAKRFAGAHIELTEWMRMHSEEAKERVRRELALETTRDVKRELVDRCWTRMRFVTEVDLSSFQSFVKAAQKVGFLDDAGDLSRLVEVPR
jgi:NitT/TauT family transport system substrate-binding protein